MNSTCGEVTPASSIAFMKVGSVWVASRAGISPMDPDTSSANTTPIDSGCASLSRLSRNVTPCGFISGWQFRCLKTSRCPELERPRVIATCAAWL